MLKGNEFNKCKTIPDVIVMTNKLKEKGEDLSEINKLASLKRRELMTTVSKKVNVLEKQVLRASIIPKNPITHIALNVKNLNSNHITINRDKSIEI